MPKHPTPRPFTDVLGDIDRGRLLDELADRFAEVVRAAAETDKAGALVLKIKIKPNTKTGTIDVTPDIATSIPKPDRRTSIFFADADGGLHRNDPAQHQLPGLDPDAEKTTDTTPPTPLGLVRNA
jgi:hypothetical protein